MKAFITGTDGFMGSHLADHLLAKGYEVVGLIRPSPIKNINHLKDNPKMKIIVGDILDYSSVLRASAGADYIFHGAAISMISDTRNLMEISWATNTGGTLNIIKAAIENKVKRMLYISTCHSLGAQPIYPSTEEALPNPVDIYAASKASAEYLCKALMNMNPELDIIISRAFNHYGERQRENVLIPKIIMQVLRNTENKVVLEASEPTRDFTYVGDIVDGYISIVEKGRRGEVYNLCSGVEKSVRQIAEEVVALMGFNHYGKLIFTDARKADLMRSVGNASKAKTELGWEPKTEWEDGLLKTIDWYMKRPRKT